MPFNVCDKNGNHVGFITEPYFQCYNVFKVAVTAEKISDEQIDISAMKDKLAGAFVCKNVLGNVNDEKFQNVISQLIEGDYSSYKYLSSTDFIKFLAMDKLRDIEEFIKYNKEDVNGYVLVDIDKLHFQDGTAIIDEIIDYISENKVDEDLPIYAKIIDYPIINTNVSGLYYYHTTRINFMSGNFATEIQLPVIIYAKKDMIINLYPDSKAIRKVFCDGIIYKFGMFM